MAASTVLPAPHRLPARPALRLVEAPAPASRWRSVLVGLAVVLVTGALVVGLARPLLAGAEVPQAAGHVVLQPGETLWDVAVRSAPADVDPRAQLEALRRLNGFGTGPLDAWTVVLVPAP
jgi:hypothetical protein